MRPVAILRFSATEGPAYFAEWLDTHGIAWQVIALDAGEPVPADPAAFAGIGMMGGPMSVNDPLPWIPQVETLLRASVAQRVPVIGHCLGGQLLARALGATVARTAQPEIGWINVMPDPAAIALAHEWFGSRASLPVFQWHYDAFALPAGATRVLTNAFNPNQAYVVDALHIGFQCHIEMTAALVDVWCRLGGDELPAVAGAGVQSEAMIRSHLPARIAALHGVAASVYTRWSRGLRR